VPGLTCGIVLPFFDAAQVADAAVAAEAAGWAGVFLAETVWGVDAWVSLAAAAVRTSTLRLGTMLTPAARIKPWDLASRVGTVDRLSGGRAQLAVGLGALHPGWVAFEGESSRRERAVLLDECLAVYDGLMRGQPFAFDGARYTVAPTDFYPPDPPVQRPRPPVWVVGGMRPGGPVTPSLARAARWDGLIPNVLDADGARGPADPAEVAELVDAVRRLRADAGLPWAGYDVVVEGVTPAADPAGAAMVQAFAQVGATWWIESDWSVAPDAAGVAQIRARIDAGPPT
jgi:alkanesulfonate monooxygenase SsuD/methylene tetrahydromethanopterin reductase-like flavin-dependent oxidoreductase (luciferase family)